jgi:hypothetical protein
LQSPEIKNQLFPIICFWKVLFSLSTTLVTLLLILTDLAKETSLFSLFFLLINTIPLSLAQISFLCNALHDPCHRTISLSTIYSDKQFLMKTKLPTLCLIPWSLHSNLVFIWYRNIVSKWLFGNSGMMRGFDIMMKQWVSWNIDWYHFTLLQG